jgi:hypothetical protein
MNKFHALETNRLTIVDLAGLSNETIIAGKAVNAALGTLGTSALDTFIADDTVFRANLITKKGSLLTEKIRETDKQRDEYFSEIWRTADTASKSSILATADAGKNLVTFLLPYRNVAKEPLMSETSTINYLKTKFDADPMLQSAASTLQLTSVFANFFTANMQVSNLWNERANEEAVKSPSPSSVRGNLERSYNKFCDVVVQTIDLQPSPELENLFSVMNEIRIKYSRSLPVQLADVNTSTAPIDIQQYTGTAITPIPRVFLKTGDNKTVELRFTMDFYVTYRNNIEVGEAKLFVHGKGKYTGKYITTFHIEKKEE